MMTMVMMVMMMVMMMGEEEEDAEEGEEEEEGERDDEDDASKPGGEIWYVGLAGDAPDSQSRPATHESARRGSGRARQRSGTTDRETATGVRILVRV